MSLFYKCDICNNLISSDGIEISISKLGNSVPSKKEHRCMKCSILYSTEETKILTKIRELSLKPVDRTGRVVNDDI